MQYIPRLEGDFLGQSALIEAEEGAFEESFSVQEGTIMPLAINDGRVEHLPVRGIERG